MLKVDKLSKYYGHIAAVKDVSFHVPRGSIVGLVGPNGAGKTTLLDCLTTIRNADEGEVYVEGHSIHREPAKAKRYIAYVPEFPNIFDYLTVW